MVIHVQLLKLEHLKKKIVLKLEEFILGNISKKRVKNVILMNLLIVNASRASSLLFMEVNLTHCLKW